MVMQKTGGKGIPGRSWYKVQVNNGAKYDKADLLNLIKSRCAVPFAPIYFTKMVSQLY